jgi:hypothetical protein
MFAAIKISKPYHEEGIVEKLPATYLPQKLTE